MTTLENKWDFIIDYAIESKVDVINKKTNIKTPLSRYFIEEAKKIDEMIINLRYRDLKRTRKKKGGGGAKLLA